MICCCFHQHDCILVTGYCMWENFTLPQIHFQLHCPRLQGPHRMCHHHTCSCQARSWFLSLFCHNLSFSCITWRLFHVPIGFVVAIVLCTFPMSACQTLGQRLIGACPMVAFRSSRCRYCRRRSCNSQLWCLTDGCSSNSLAISPSILFAGRDVA